MNLFRQERRTSVSLLNPLGLAEICTFKKRSRICGRAKEVQKAQKAIEAGTCPLDALEELKPVMSKIQAAYPEVGEGNVGVGSTIFAVKPGDGSAREQAASCQKSSRRLGKHCCRICDKTLSLQPD